MSHSLTRRLHIAFDLTYHSNNLSNIQSARHINALANQLNVALMDLKRDDRNVDITIITNTIEEQQEWNKRLHINNSKQANHQSHSQSTNDIVKISSNALHDSLFKQPLALGCHSTLSFSLASSLNRSQCIQLSPDSSHVLTSICSEPLTYVIAGLTDGAGVEKNTSLLRSQSLHIPSAKLPIKQVIKGGLRRSALNIDVVANILATSHQRTNNNDVPFGTDQYGRIHEQQLKQLSDSDSHEWMNAWRYAFDQHIPSRLRWHNEHFKQ